MSFAFNDSFSTPRPKLRRPPLREQHVFALKVELDDSAPLMWRRLEIRSDISLLLLHRIVQAAFGWYDYHLYRFALGGGPFELTSELFLCDFDVEEADAEDAGTPVGAVRLDETLQQPGDTLNYAYDYGDGWEFTIRLESARLIAGADSTAKCVAGSRAAPPEDCGGIKDAEGLAKILEDPSRFDLSEVNQSIDDWLATPPGFAPAHVLTGADLEVQEVLLRFPYFKTLVESCHRPEARTEIVRRLQRLRELQFTADTGIEVSKESGKTAKLSRGSTDSGSREEALSAVQHLLDQIGDGVRFTQAGYLPPSIALSLANELGLSGFELSAGGESKMHQVFAFREAMQKVGLLRKSRGELLLTKAGKSARKDAEVLWEHLADRLLPDEKSGREFTREAALVTLLVAATSQGEFDLELAAAILSESGWNSGGEPVKSYNLVLDGSWQPVLLWYITPRKDRHWFAGRISPVAVELAREAVLGMEPAS